MGNINSNYSQQCADTECQAHVVKVLTHRAERKDCARTAAGPASKRGR